MGRGAGGFCLLGLISQWRATGVGLRRLEQRAQATPLFLTDRPVSRYFLAHTLWRLFQVHAPHLACGNYMQKKSIRGHVYEEEDKMTSPKRYLLSLVFSNALRRSDELPC